MVQKGTPLAGCRYHNCHYSNGSPLCIRNRVYTCQNGSWVKTGGFCPGTPPVCRETRVRSVGGIKRRKKPARRVKTTKRKRVR